jgi:hypothetical protein
MFVTSGRAQPRGASGIARRRTEKERAEALPFPSRGYPLAPTGKSSGKISL